MTFRRMTFYNLRSFQEQYSLEDRYYIIIAKVDRLGRSEE